VAASLAVIISFGTYGVFFKKVSGNRIVTQFYKPYDVTLVNRSENRDINVVLREALMYYQNEEYSEAIPLFQEVLEMNPMNVESNLYTGISQFEIKLYEEAKQSFSRVIEHDDNLYIEQAEWCLGFCYLMLDEKDKAIIHFTRVKDVNGLYSKDAKKILRKLK
jgi:tetratricopeptide (TPR) repeat protein